MLPTTLAVTATAIILTGVPWAEAIARISDQSLRYSVDKTTREVLFLPLPSELRQESSRSWTLPWTGRLEASAPSFS